MNNSIIAEDYKEYLNNLIELDVKEIKEKEYVKRDGSKDVQQIIVLMDAHLYSYYVDVVPKSKLDLSKMKNKTGKLSFYIKPTYVPAKRKFGEKEYNVKIPSFLIVEISDD